MKDLTPEEATALENKLQELESKKKKKEERDHEENVEDADCDSWLILIPHHDMNALIFATVEPKSRI